MALLHHFFIIINIFFSKWHKGAAKSYTDSTHRWVGGVRGQSRSALTFAVVMTIFTASLTSWFPPPSKSLQSVSVMGVGGGLLYISKTAKQAQSSQTL